MFYQAGGRPSSRSSACGDRAGGVSGHSTSMEPRPHERGPADEVIHSYLSFASIEPRSFKRGNTSAVSSGILSAFPAEFEG